MATESQKLNSGEFQQISKMIEQINLQQQIYNQEKEVMKNQMNELQKQLELLQLKAKVGNSGITNTIPFDTLDTANAVQQSQANFDASPSAKVENLSETDEEEDFSAKKSESKSKILKNENPLYTSQEECHIGSKKTLNILLLGAIGVGKSTWINGIANYISFNTLEDAIAAREPICLIPSKFVYCDENFQGHEIKIDSSHGMRDENEVFSHLGHSFTQEPKIYQIETAKYVINFIDTPGIGDIRGPNQDKKHMMKILNAIRQYKDLHAICILLSANQTQMCPTFRYYISELLLPFHKDALDNIFFVFPFSRRNYYKPGDTMVPLHTFLEYLKHDGELDISLNKNNVICIDNEAFRGLCTYKSDTRIFDDDYFLEFAKSWKQSAIETHRFLEIAARSKPHSVADTLSISRVRTIIMHLANCLANINDLIVSSQNEREKMMQYTAKNNFDEVRQKERNYEKQIKEYQAEQQQITDVSLRFGSFLQKNAILPYNDAFEKYVQLAINEKEQSTRAKLNCLKKLQNNHRQEMAMLQEAVKNPTFGGENFVTLEEVDDMKVQLFGLKNSGKFLKNLFTATEDGKHVTAVLRYNPATTTRI